MSKKVDKENGEINMNQHAIKEGNRIKLSKAKVEGNIDLIFLK